MAAGPLAEPRPARIGVQATTALIELAEICGLARLPVEGRRPMEATTYGVGMAMEEAIERGYADLVVGVGGSASTDGGVGAAAALGARILDARGEPVRPCGSGLAEVASVDLDPMLALLEGVSLVVATDVESPLTGSKGAAQAFGAQKGASAEQIETLDAGLRRWAAVLQEATGVDVRELPGVGAAGGFAAAGKAPQAALVEAQAAGKPVIAVAGSFSANADLAGMSARYSLTVAAGSGGIRYAMPEFCCAR
ncbi:MAG: glycerate kinase [Geodermatophilaceae bacterium]|nr:glycerate kinase [Geodermatophilaceae bacterium]